MMGFSHFFSDNVWACNMYVCMFLNFNAAAAFLLLSFFWAITILCESNIKAICSSKHAPLAAVDRARSNFPPTCFELVVAAISWLVWITIIGTQPTPQSSYQARYLSLLFLYQPTALPEWQVTSGALLCRQGQRSALRSLYLGVLAGNGNVSEGSGHVVLSCRDFCWDLHFDWFSLLFLQLLFHTAMHMCFYFALSAASSRLLFTSSVLSLFLLRSSRKCTPHPEGGINKRLHEEIFNIRLWVND